MKKILFFILSIFFVLPSISQEREDDAPASLSYKSKEITKALYWNKNSESGKWENRKNTKLVYKGEGIKVDNFNSLFVGEYKNRRYLFLDFKKYKWKYPSLEMDWVWYRTIIAASLSDEDYDKMQNLKDGEVLEIKPRFHNEMFKANRDYSFPFFLKLTETLYHSSETIYNIDKKNSGESYAELVWKKENPPITFIVLKKFIDSKGKELIRFSLYPSAFKELINSFYFEIDISTYNNLFTPDKTLKYE